MDTKTSSALAKRLAAYSAMAGVTFAVVPTADAQVVYHDFEPDLLPHTTPFCSIHLDFDDDGERDLRLFDKECNNRYYYYTNRWYFGELPGRDVNGVLEVSFGMQNLEYGSPVGPSANFYREGVIAKVASSCNYRSGYFYDDEGYAGFRFVAGDGEFRYGWIRLFATGCPIVVTAYEYAYEAQPNTPILTGAVSAALLGGAVNQTAFPAAGGTLVYTFTVENTTDGPLPLDLWLDVERNGNDVLMRRLGSGTLPAGASATRTVSVRVPSGTPEGAYQVDFKLGDFASGQFITFERYTVTKEAGAEAGAGEPFAVAPVEGDLFSEADAAGGIVGTHALTAPRPNPTTGRAEVALAVAEGQDVSVAVYDALGRRVALLHDGPLSAGAAHRLVFDGSALPAGVYVVRAVGEAFSDTRVLTLTQ